MHQALYTIKIDNLNKVSQQIDSLLVLPNGWPGSVILDKKLMGILAGYQNWIKAIGIVIIVYELRR